MSTVSKLEMLKAARAKLATVTSINQPEQKNSKFHYVPQLGVTGRTSVKVKLLPSASGALTVSVVDYVDKDHNFYGRAPIVGESELPWLLKNAAFEHLRAAGNNEHTKRRGGAFKKLLGSEQYYVNGLILDTDDDQSTIGQIKVFKVGNRVFSEMEAISAALPATSSLGFAFFDVDPGPNQYTLTLRYTNEAFEPGGNKAAYPYIGVCTADKDKMYAEFVESKKPEGMLDLIEALPHIEELVKEHGRPVPSVAEQEAYIKTLLAEETSRVNSVTM